MYQYMFVAIISKGVRVIKNKPSLKTNLKEDSRAV